MITFKQFKSTYVDETLKVDNGVVTYTTQQRQNRGDDLEDGQIDTFVGLQPHKELTADSGNVKIFSTYLYRTNDTVTDILKSLKGSGPHEVNQKSYEMLLNAAADSALKVVKNNNIDTIIFPKSSSAFLSDFVKKLEDKLGSSVAIIPDAIIKKQIDKVSVEKGDMTSYINFEHPKFNTLTASTIKALEKRIAQVAKDNDEAGKGRTISIKDISKRNAKFVTNFLEVVKELSTLLQDKNVLIIDDVLSSGATFAEMVRLVRKENIKNVFGYTLFKNTSTPKKKS